MKTHFFAIVAFAATLPVGVLAAEGDEAPADGPLAMVRIVPLTSPPAGWLELEERILALAGERLREPPSPASQAAGQWRVPGYRFDRVQMRVRQALTAVEEALAEKQPRRAIPHLKDVDDLLDLGSAVAVMPASLLRRYHRLAAVAHGELGDRAATRAARDYVGLTGVEPPDALVAQAGAARAPEDASGLTLELGNKATVYLDGVELGVGSQRRYDIAPGLHYLRVVAPGRAAFGERLRLAPGEIGRRKIRLESARNPMEPLAGELSVEQPKQAASAALTEISEQIGIDTLLVMIPAPDGVYLRRFDSVADIYSAAVRMSLDPTADQLARAVDRALGLAPELMPEEVVNAAAADPSSSPLLGTPVVEKKSLAGNPWLWVGLGAAVVIGGGIVAIVAASTSSNEPGKAQVWVCPEQGPCAP